MIESFEAGSLAETQDTVCRELASTIKDHMAIMGYKDLLTTSITETMPPNPLLNYEHDLTLYYCLMPFNDHVGFSAPDEQLMTMVHHGGGMYAWDVASLEVVSVPKDIAGNIVLPKSFHDWNVLFEIREYVGVLKSDDSRPNDDEITVCRILLEDASVTIDGSEAIQIQAA